MAKSYSFMEDVIKGVKDAGKVLHSNEAINKIGQNFGGGFEVVGKMLGKDQMKIDKALSSTFKNSDGSLKYGKIAGSYIGMSAAARVATGGGLYRDRNGNTNIAGVPFI